ncbi:response regulator [Rhizobium halophytocola]|uniref:CheY-like chemotaxis protein n=1 Tax=Rhizobium halophytocola TaxID=735519 RepID=A0ABS4E082_9HYPH|nr:response regulator [Rhizobium halophytocola]MBP1851343.1 CheY-like chemotaxis protein [Rhizobium halophytocola]
MEILILEDNPTNALILKRMAAKVLDGEIVVEGDANRALALCHERRFDLLIVDQILPGRTGVQITRAVRQIDAYADVPIVMVTADTDPSLSLEAVAAGVTTFLTKPVEAIAFREVLRIHAKPRLAEAS